MDAGRSVCRVCVDFCIRIFKMSDFRTYSHDLLTEFIEVYRNNPCLWKITNEDYKRKDKKLLAYNILLEIIRKVERDATIDNVKKKINSLRAGYRKEHKKVEDSKRTGSGTDQVYEPKLWYYSQLEFLNDQGQGEQSTDNMESSEQETPDIENTFDNEHENTFDAEHEYDSQSNNVSSPTTPATSIASSTRRQQQGIEDTISLIGKRLQNPDDEYDTIGKNVAIKLRNMTSIQQGLAEKLINEVIFLGRFERLTFNTTIHSPVLVQVPQKRPLIHMPAVPGQMKETQAFNLPQDSHSPVLVQVPQKKRPLIHMPAVLGQMKETQAFNLPQDSHSPVLVQVPQKRPLIHMPAVPGQMKETQAFNLPQDSHSPVLVQVPQKKRPLIHMPAVPGQMKETQAFNLPQDSRSPGPVQVPQKKRPLIHMPAVPGQIQETQAVNLPQDSQVISIPDSLVEYLIFDNNNLYDKQE